MRDPDPDAGATVATEVDVGRAVGQQHHRQEHALRSCGPLPGLLKISLIAEVLVAYGTARWRMGRRDIRVAVTASRAGLDRSSATVTLERDAWRTAIRLSRIVSRTLRILPTDSRCLIQALVLSRLLSRRGIMTRIVIGAHSRAEFEAHAWVEYATYALQSTEGFADSRLLEL